jgi:predicted methyltransferase
MRTVVVASLTAVLLGGCLSIPSRVDAIMEAVAGENRPAADRARDPARQPAEVLRFAGVRRGQKIGEYMPGGGYFTRILAKAVGPAGKVYAFQPSEIVKLQPKYLTDIEAVAAGAPVANIVVISAATDRFAAPEPLDLVLTVQNYHDLHTRFAAPGAAAKFNAAVYRALKPGGAYVVVDHRAAAGSGLAVADSLHRIDPAIVKAEVLAAGFRLDAESPFLETAADPLTANVFAPAIRGKTSQFALKFRKPR